MEESIVQYNYNQLLALNYQDEEIIKFNDFIEGLDEMAIRNLYENTKHIIPSGYSYWTAIIKTLRNYSLFEVAIRCGYINKFSEEFIQNFNKYIYPLFEDSLELRERFPLIINLYNRINTKIKDSFEFENSFFEFLSIFMDLNNRETDRLIFRIKFDENFLKALESILDKPMEDELLEEEQFLLESCLSFLEVFITINELLIEIDENEDIRITYLSFFNYITHDNKIADFLDFFIEYSGREFPKMDYKENDSFMEDLRFANENLMKAFEY